MTTFKKTIVTLCALVGAALTSFAAWQPGLQWGEVSGSGINTTAYPSTTNVSVTIEKATQWASSTSSTTIWKSNTTYVYWGMIYFDGSVYRFGESIDDVVWLKINDKVVINDTLHSNAAFTTVELPEGWYPFELRMYNGTGGGGATTSPNKGFSNTKGFGLIKCETKEEADLISTGADMTVPEDDGNMSLFRYDDGLGFDDCIDVSGYPASFGVVSPAYGSNSGYSEGQVVEISAPASWSSEDGKISMTCVGAERFEVDTTTGEKTPLEPIVGNRFSHTHSDKMLVVVWQWEPVRVGDPVWVGRVDNDWLNAANWENYVVPSSADNVILSGVNIEAAGRIDAASLTLTDGASLRVQGADNAHIGVTIAGDIEVGAESALSVFAGRCTGLATNFPTLYAEANLISARNIHIASRGTFTTGSDILTGVPVFVRCENFTLDRGGVVDATSLGYGWVASVDPLPDDGIKSNNGGMTYAPGYGYSYDNSGGYGGRGNSTSYGKVYGYKYAPWMPGSPDGVYNKFGAHWSIGLYGVQNSGGWVRGGGNVRIEASGRITVGGEIRANCYYRFYGAGSGGGIWLTAKNYTFFESAFLQARGGDCARKYTSSGGGGRISVGAGLTAEEIAALATGEVPEALTYGDAPAFVKTDVLCGETHPIVRDPYLYPRGATKNRDGTSTYVLNTNKVVAVKVSMRAADGEELCLGGLVEDAAGGAVIDVNDFNLKSGVTYTGGAWIISDSTGSEVAVGTGDKVTLPATTAGALLVAWSVTEKSTIDADEAVVPSGNILTFTGESGAAWEDAANWSGGAVPTLADAVTLSDGQFVVATSVVKAATLTVGEGATLAVGGTTANVAAQVGVSFAKYGIKTTGDLIVDGALSVGGTLANYDFGYNEAEVSVGGNLTLNGAGATAFYASRPAWSLFETYNIINVYHSRLDVKIGGNITLNGSSVIYAANDNLTGAAVRFTAKNVSVAPDAAFNAVARGYGAVAHKGEVPIDCTTYPNGYNQSVVYGYGQSWDTDTASYGGRSYNNDALEYGFALAPFLPGSPPRGTVRGGGTIWIESDGQFTHRGAINANGTQSGSVMSSGGGIWILTRSFVAAATATVTADAGTLPGVGSADASGGGRIAIVEGGYTDEDVAVFTFGGTPDGYTITESADGFINSVKGGEGFITSGAEKSTGKDGTFRYAKKPLTDARTIITSGDPVNAVNGTVTYGTFLVTEPSYTFENENYGLTRDGEARMPCVGYIVTNEAGVVIKEGYGTSVTFTPAEEGNTYLVWKYGAPIPEITVDIPEGAGGKVVASEGTTLTTSGKVYIDANGTLTAVPDEGYEFLYWLGEVHDGTERSAAISLTGGVKRKVRPVFRPAEAKATRRWVANAKGSFYDSANWEGGIIPGLNDDVIITNGVCYASNYVEMASITLTDNARLFAGANVSAANATKSLSDFKNSLYVVSYGDTRIERAVVKVNGNVMLEDTAEFALGGLDPNYRCYLSAANITLDGTAKMLVSGGELTDGYTHKTGSGFVTVSGKFTLNDESAFYPLSAGYTGGSVVITCDTFTLATNAMVNANGLGYRWYPTKTPQSLAPGGGSGYGTAAGHGGYGKGYNATYGNTYDCLYAPIQPGSCTLVAYNSIIANSYPGGGVIRIHARNCHIAGTMTAIDIFGHEKAWHKDLGFIYNAGSGGSIWITAERIMRVYPGAQIIVRGRWANYGYASGGGRVSIGRKISQGELDGLIENGDEIPVRLSGRPLKVLDKVAFTNLFNDVSLSLTVNGSQQEGSFVFLDGGRCDGTVIILR